MVIIAVVCLGVDVLSLLWLLALMMMMMCCRASVAQPQEHDVKQTAASDNMPIMQQLS
jgi:hypothetical protein